MKFVSAGAAAGAIAILTCPDAAKADEQAATNGDVVIEDHSEGLAEGADAVEAETKPKYERQYFGATGTNYAGNIRYSSSEVYVPETEEEVVQFIKNTEDKQFKAIGDRRATSDIADTDGVHISLEKFKSIEIDTLERTVTFGAGVTFAELIEFLKGHKMALYNVPEFTSANVVSAVVSGNIGTNQSTIAHRVYDLRLVNPNGDIQILELEDVDFKYYLHAFGALGVITEMSLEILDEFAVKKCIYEGVSWELMASSERYIQALNSSNDSLSFFSDWSGPYFNSVWTGEHVFEKVREDLLTKSYDEVCVEDFYGGKLVERAHPIPGNDVSNVTSSGWGLWYDKLPHFKEDEQGMGFQSEFFVKVAEFPSVMNILTDMHELIGELVLTSEFRPVNADDIPFSPAYKQKMVMLSFTWKNRPKQVGQALFLINSALAKFNPKHNFGKSIFTLDTKYFNKVYPEEDLERLREMIEAFDT